ncbi:MAG TPA: hypothetical protein VIL25_09020 [Vicinamibacterales bacterium]
MARTPADSHDPVERAWHALLRRAPRREPPPYLQARLLAATRASWPAPGEVAAVPDGRGELVVTAGVLAGAAALTLAPVLVVAALFVFDAGIVVEGVARTCVWLVSWLSTGVSVWDVLMRAGRVAAAAMTSPAGTLLLLGGTLTAWLALVGLSRLLPVERETVDA